MFREVYNVGAYSPCFCVCVSVGKLLCPSLPFTACLHRGLAGWLFHRPLSLLYPPLDWAESCFPGGSFSRVCKRKHEGWGGAQVGSSARPQGLSSRPPVSPVDSCCASLTSSHLRGGQGLLPFSSLAPGGQKLFLVPLILAKKGWRPQQNRRRFYTLR